MKEVKIISRFNQKQISGQYFKDEIKMKTWINDCIKKNAWGLPEKWVHADDITPELLTRVLKKEEITIPDEPKIRIRLEKPKTYFRYLISADYKVEIIDRTKKFEEIEEKRRKKKEQIKKFKKDTSWIDKSDMHPEQKELFKILIDNL